MTNSKNDDLTDDKKKFSDALDRLINTSKKAGEKKVVEKMQAIFQQPPTSISFITGALCVLASDHKELNAMLDSVDLYIETFGGAK